MTVGPGSVAALQAATEPPNPMPRLCHFDDAACKF